MKKGYWVSLYFKIENQENLKKYSELATPVIKSYGGVPLIRGGKHDTFSGDDFSRTVVWEFPSYAKALGVNTDDLLLSQPESGEQALEITDMLVKSESLDLIVIDSVAALTSKAEIEGEMGDSHVGLLARLMAQALRKLTANMDKLKTTVIFINQIRDNIGGFGYGNSQVTPGGKALKFFSSVRLDIRRIGTVKGKGEEVIGNETRVKVVKNKVSPPFKQAEFQIIYGEGISNEGEILDMAVKQGLVEKRGAFFRLEDEAIGQGKANARQFLKDNKKIKNSLAREVKKNLLQSKKS